MRNTAVQMFATKVMALDITPKQMLYFLDWYQLALEMEKQETIKAFNIGNLDGYNYGCNDDIPLYEDGEQYYNETYGKDG